MEHRWGRRIVVDMPIQVAAVSMSPIRRAQLVNLSITGAFIEADFRPRLLSRVQIMFGLSPSPQADALSIAAYVARNNRHGFGVEWCELSGVDAAYLWRAAGVQSYRLTQLSLTGSNLRS
jgi:hypothetical protein